VLTDVLPRVILQGGEIPDALLRVSEGSITWRGVGLGSICGYEALAVSLEIAQWLQERRARVCGEDSLTVLLVDGIECIAPSRRAELFEPLGETAQIITTEVVDGAELEVCYSAAPRAA
jgi:hypothetical protein